MKNILILVSVLLFSCKHLLKKENDFDKMKKAKVISTFRATSDMNDSYFLLKEGNYFEFYKSLYDSLKNTVYGGTFSEHLDTIKLNFFNPEGEKIFGNRAILNKENNEINFYNASNAAKRMHIFN